MSRDGSGQEEEVARSGWRRVRVGMRRMEGRCILRFIMLDVFFFYAFDLLLAFLQYLFRKDNG